MKTYTAKVRATPRGAVELEPGDEEATVYGTVEIAWYPDRLEVTALDAGLAEVTAARTTENGEDVVLELRPPNVDELPDEVPGAD